MRYARYLPLLLVAVVAGWLLVGHIRYARLPEEQKIRLLVDELAEAAERRDVGDLLAPVSESYRDPFHPDKESLRLTLMQLSLRFRAVDVQLHQVEVTMTPDATDLEPLPPEATARVRATVLMGTDPETPPTLPFLERYWGDDAFLLDLRREEGAWRILRARRSGATAD